MCVRASQPTHDVFASSTVAARNAQAQQQKHPQQRQRKHTQQQRCNSAANPPAGVDGARWVAPLRTFRRPRRFTSGRLTSAIRQSACVLVCANGVTDGLWVVGWVWNWGRSKLATSTHAPMEFLRSLLSGSAERLFSVPCGCDLSDLGRIAVLVHDSRASRQPDDTKHLTRLAETARLVDTLNTCLSSPTDPIVSAAFDTGKEVLVIYQKVAPN